MPDLSSTKPGAGFTALPSFSFEPVAAAAFMKTAESCAKAGFAWQQELGRFAMQRWQADAEMPAALGQCRSLADIVTLQQKWFATAVEDYGTEAGRIVEIADQAVREGIACWQEVPNGATKASKPAAE